MVLERAIDAEGPFLLPSSSLCRVAVLNKVPFVFWKSNLDFLIDVTSEKTISKNCRVKVLATIRNGSPTIQKERKEKGKRKSKSIVYSVGVLIGIAQNVLI